MTKVMSPTGIKMEETRQEVYKEWIKMHKRGWSKRSACASLSEDYPYSESTIWRMIRRCEMENGTARKLSETRNAEHILAYNRYVELMNEGYPEYKAFKIIGEELGRCDQTIRGWVKDIQHAKGNQ